MARTALETVYLKHKMHRPDLGNRPQAVGQGRQLEQTDDREVATQYLSEAFLMLNTVNVSRGPRAHVNAHHDHEQLAAARDLPVGIGVPNTKTSVAARAASPKTETKMNARRQQPAFGATLIRKYGLKMRVCCKGFVTAWLPLPRTHPL